MTLTMRENFSLLLSMGPPLGGYAEIICFRSSCRRGRSSSFLSPGFVREDEIIVNTVPVSLFLQVVEKLPVQCSKIFSPTISRESPVICPEVNISVYISR